MQRNNRLPVITNVAAYVKSVKLNIYSELNVRVSKRKVLFSNIVFK